ncbi:hypothetical protein Pmani_013127 [Petrolisthes manimaculis]|uniref:Neurotransmitter-gated ion-channel ligand-binding domain-containing protein n=1 Tax=Petrolisthes manimaculis TaxID=1843537 RepID=A0AAE1UEE9_9EUCA|nr:hypothetical protein Pmani_013127 [Petrolisthes manimaculis]
MDTQRCPLQLGSFAYTTRDVMYQWNKARQVVIASDLMLSQFDIIATPSGFENTTRISGRQVLNATDVIVPAASYGLLRDPGVRPLCPHHGPLMGLLLDQQGGYVGQSGPW